MISYMKSIVFFVLFILLAFEVSAADNAKYRVLGFSKDGAYFAYEVYGHRDGGAIYSSIKIVNAATGKECIKPYEAEDFVNLNLDSLRIANLDSSEVDLDKFRLNEDTRGNVVFEDLKLGWKQAKKINIKKLKIDLSLSFNDSKNKCRPEMKRKLVKLAMIKGKKLKLIFDEKEDSKLCVIEAKVEKVINYKNTVVCIIAFSTPGFEGVNIRYLFVVNSL